jgi:hypothetical protein
MSCRRARTRRWQTPQNRQGRPRAGRGFAVPRETPNFYRLPLRELAADSPQPGTVVKCYHPMVLRNRVVITRDGGGKQRASVPRPTPTPGFPTRTGQEAPRVFTDVASGCAERAWCSPSASSTASSTSSTSTPGLREREATADYPSQPRDRPFGLIWTDRGEA